MSRINGLVLAGGQSRRMGANKALLEIQGVPQYVRIYDLLQRHLDAVYVSCKDEQIAGFPEVPQRFITDSIDVPGPLGGILSALSFDPEAAWLILACDLVLADDAMVQQLISERDPLRMATCFAGPEDGLPEPLVAIWEPTIRVHTFSRLAEGIHCPRKVLLRSDIHLIQCLRPLSLTNANTPDDLQAALEALKG